ncbi:MAG: capsular biosynthesis protein CpsI [Gammaproteobacteria bacterium RIFCSPLOWO2_02_FULL_61_13]|nr:MAG: capsular biosynthesis protein CpsI [Gammaproteobacteria bacterium RIFCSPLOWO2_02_FULL_61_13]
MKILITGAAGFIGSALCSRLLQRGDAVTGLDNLSDYYDVRLKEARLARLTSQQGFSFLRQDIADTEGLRRVFADVRPQRVVHLAAQTGVRYSLVNPHAYVNANLAGFVNTLEGCRHNEVEHLVFASSSAVYGANTQLPFSVHAIADHPVSLYGATKRSNELMAHAYSHLFQLPATGLRFFTVYGPWGRPDMSLFLFTRNILDGKPIDVFNQGNHSRDFTYIDDIVEGVVRVLDRIPRPAREWDAMQPDPALGAAPFRLYNIGNHTPVPLLRFIEVLEQCLGEKAVMNFLPLQPGDVPDTHADVNDLIRDVGYSPSTPVEEGIRRFVDWYREYYGA